MGSVRAALTACLVVLYVWPIDREPGVNVYAHLDQAAAIVADHTLAIDRFIEAPQPNTIDWSRAPNGHFYPAKSPGAAFLAVPPFFLLYHVERRLGIDPLGSRWFRRNAIAVNSLVNVPVAVLTVLLLIRLGKSLGADSGASISGAIAIGLGTGFYPYATAFYAHVPAAAALTCTAVLICRERPRFLGDAAAGLFAGIAVMLDYPAALAVIGLGTLLAAFHRTRLLAFVIGGLVPFAALCAYHTAAFGRPLSTAYAYQNADFRSAEGVFVNQPSLRVFWQLTFGRYRGIFFYSPVLLCTFVGALTTFRVRSSHAEKAQKLRLYTAAVLGILFAWLLFNASYRIWWGGYTAGARLIIPALVLLAPVVGTGIERFPRAGFALLMVSALNYFAATHVWLTIRETYSDPLLQVIYPRFLSGALNRWNVGMALGLRPALSLLVPFLAAVMILCLTWREMEGTPARSDASVPQQIRS